MADEEKDKSTAKPIILGLLFGVIFGFLLQKGGVAKYHVLMGVLLLEDFTVVKVMLSAVIVGMAGIFTLRKLGLIEFHLKPTRYGAQIVGGLVFGAGFALSGYCPGTGAAALGQGNFDALAMVLGMIAGSYLFAEMSGWIGRTLERVGERGELTLPDLVRMPTYPFAAAAGVVLVLVLVALHFATR